MKPTRALLVLAAAFAVAAGRAVGAPIRVVTLSTVLTEIAREVGGSEVVVSGLVRPGVDPHVFNPSPADIRMLVDADLVLASGLRLEPYLERVVASSAPSGLVVAVGDRVPLVLTMADGTSGAAEKDPHWWHSIGNVIFATDLVRSELARLRPASAQAFAANAGRYRRKLEALQSWASLEAARLPAGRRILVTSHDAFAYLAHDYGFTVRPVSGLSTESEPDARRLAQLVDFVRAERVGAVFVESSASPRLVESLIAETGVRLGGTLYADGLGPAGSGAEDYASMYRHNLSAIVDALAR
jgi:ABC-type Zn uptake system ZnuABC Zn-binding protein ZnuA